MARKMHVSARKSDEDMLDNYPAAQAFSVPRELQYGFQLWNNTEMAWNYKLIFASLEECKSHFNFYTRDTCRIVLMSKYYPYPALYVVYFKEFTE